MNALVKRKLRYASLASSALKTFDVNESLRGDPRALEAVRANLKKGGPLTESLLGALRDASTAPAQALLAELSAADSTLKPEHRLEAARCLSRVPTPTRETVLALDQMQKDKVVGVQATYGLGTAFHNSEKQNPSVAEVTVSWRNETR